MQPSKVARTVSTADDLSLAAKGACLMNRRDFLRAGLLGAGLGASTLPACRSREQAAPAASSTSSTTATPPPFELDEVTLSELEEALASGKYTAVRLVEMYLERIDAVDRQGPTLRSILETNPEALDIARTLDEERRGGNLRGPLHGIPVLVKDNLDTADQMSTTAGSLALEGVSRHRDSFVVQRLRAAGAVLLGKTNLSEWANFRSTRSTSGWSGRGGLCINPFALDRNPCGSSSGSGVAVSANLAAVAIGTETDGSIVCPSNANGLVGIKPTLGLVSRTGIIPIAHSQDTAGPMGRTVRDAAIVLGAITGMDPDDPATGASESRSHTDYTPFLVEDGLEGARIGVVREAFGFHDRVDALMESALEAMRAQGATLVDPANVAPNEDLDASELEVLLYEFKADLNVYLAGLGPDVPVHSLAELIAFNESHRDEEMPYFGQELFHRAEAKGPLSTPEYQEALALCRRLSRDEGIDAVMDKHELDALVAPTGGPAWVNDLVNGDHFGGGSSTLAAVAGYPNITVPAGQVFGLPVGISFFGRAWSEPTLLELAYSFEQATRHRRAPRFLPTAEL